MRKLLLTIVATVSLILPNVSLASIAYDTSHRSTTINGNSSVGVNNQAAAFSNRIAVMCVFHDTASLISSVNYGADAATFVASTTVGNAGYKWDMYYLVNPTTTLSSVTVYFDRPAFGNITVATYNGAAQSGQPNATGINSSASATSLSVGATTTVDNAWIVGCWEANTGTAFTQGANTRNRAELDDSFYTYSTVIADSGDWTPAGSHSMSNSWSGSVYTGAVAMAIAPYVSSTPSTARRRPPLIIQ